jgi:hypothetical protein
MVLSPSVFPMLFKLGLIFLNGKKILNNCILKSYDIVRIYSRLLPYSYYRVFYAKLRGFSLLHKFAFFRRLKARRRFFSRFFTFRFKLFHSNFYFRLFRSSFTSIN